MNRKDQKGMYTNICFHFLLAYNQVKQGLKDYQYIDIRED